MSADPNLPDVGRDPNLPDVGRVPSRAIIQTIGVGLLGYAFMGRAHSHAYRTLSYMAWPPPLIPRLVSVAGRDAEAAREAARRFGFEDHATHWRALVEDARVELFDNSAPNNMHAEPSIAAAKAGKHVICEKPLARDAEEAYDVWQQVARTGVVHMCGFNYRFVPAIRLARLLIEAGTIGEIRHFRGRYLQEWGSTNVALWRFDKRLAGSGSLGDLGAHVIDLGRYLVGQIKTVSALTATFRPGRVADDAFAAAVGFTTDATGTIEASRFAPGRKNSLTWEINGSEGSLSFDLECPNEPQISEGNRGFLKRLVSEADDPFWAWWWPHGHVIGWEHTFIHQLHHLLTAIAGGSSVAPHGATLEDGYRAAEVCDAVLRSARRGRHAFVEYRTPAASSGMPGGGVMGRP
jgi:predicted dehydrogenase